MCENLNFLCVYFFKTKVDKFHNVQVHWSCNFHGHNWHSMSHIIILVQQWNKNNPYTKFFFQKRFQKYRKTYTYITHKICMNTNPIFTTWRAVETCTLRGAFTMGLEQIPSCFPLKWYIAFIWIEIAEVILILIHMYKYAILKWLWEPLDSIDIEHL